MTPQEQFLVWLKNNDPFVYAVVVERLKKEGMFKRVKAGELNGLGFGWSSITDGITSAYTATSSGIADAFSNVSWDSVSSTVSSAVKTLPSTLMNIKASRDREAAQKKAARRAPPPPAPKPNVSSTDEILRRLAIAQAGGNQPGGAHTPMINPNQVRNFSGTVKAVAKKPTKWEYAVAMKLASMPPAERDALIRKNAAKKAAAKSGYMTYLPVGLGFLLLFGKKIFK